MDSTAKKTSRSNSDSESNDDDYDSDYDTESTKSSTNKKVDLHQNIDTNHQSPWGMVLNGLLLVILFSMIVFLIVVCNKNSKSEVQKPN